MPTRSPGALVVSVLLLVGAGLASILPAAAATHEPAVALVEQDASPGDIGVVHPTSGERQQVTEGPDFDYQPAWSPEGRSLAFARLVENRDSGIYVADVAGGDERRISPEGLGLNVNYPSWSPTGTHVAFTDREDVWVADLAAGTARRAGAAPDGGFDFSWSPDGSQLAYVGVTELDAESGTSDLFVLGVAPPAPARQLTTDGNAESPAWSAAGPAVAASSGVLLLTPDTLAADVTCGWLVQHAGALDDVRLLGGADKVTADVAQQVERVATGEPCPAASG